MRFLSSPGIERAISKHEAEKIRLNEKSQRIQHGNHNTKKGPGRVHCNGPIGGPVKDED
jgi:hypothetical protein